MLRIVFISLSLFLGLGSLAQQRTPAPTGPNDTIVVSTVYYDGEWIPSAIMEEVLISNMSPKALAKYQQEYNKLRKAVYTTLPYARTAGAIINDANDKLEGVSSKKDRKAYLKTREAELRKEFSDPLSNMTVYQGRVLMKLIYRETGNDCYEIIKDYKGGLNARMYQTVAFFFGGNLKQEYDPVHDQTDQQIERILTELNAYWSNKPGSSTSGSHRVLGRF